MKDSYYFSHDYSARSDSKIKRLIAQHGMSGYGIFWAIIEDLYMNANTLPLDYDCIAFDLRTDKNIIDSIINDFDLFIVGDGMFGSLAVEKRLAERNEKSEKARKSAYKRWSSCERNAEALPTQYDGNAIKESKVNKNKLTKEEKIYLSAKSFYDIEIKNNSMKSNINNYSMTVDYLLNNPVLNRPVYHILKIEKQLTYDQFNTLCQLYSFDMFKDKLKVWVNNTSYSLGKTTIYSTIEAWCKNKYQK